MVIARLNGGLGNQMFQYAAGYSLAGMRGVQFKIELPTHAHQVRNHETLRAADILDFSLSSSIADPEEIRRYRDPYGLLSVMKRIVRQKIYNSYQIDWDPKFLDFGPDVYLDGYFQTDKYFESCLQEIFAEFTLRTLLASQITSISAGILSLPNPVSLHVRRGDYVQNPRTRALHYICTRAYYKEALQLIRQDVGDCDIVVFSDDVGWVRENLDLGNRVLFVSGQVGCDGSQLHPAQEMVLMSHCRHHIISNSTFSWWGAYLNRSPEKVVIAPGLWNRSRRFAHRDIVPDTWLRIPFSAFQHSIEA